ncbi:hypothetical protein [uncultured Oscillibacter sp.]|uniref:hypothetical protein n=1 Tax=uncultured Oscillibacter sp. TaxID=876091 RepID=UPI0025F8401C|nr:hypothetical protein [uncultured Oscillibacter sp.]
MLQFQNQYGSAAPMRTAAGGPPAGQTDWSREVVRGAPVPSGANVVAYNDPVAISEGAAGTPRLEMQNGLPADVIESPVSLAEARMGSLKAMLTRNVGTYIVASFLVGTQNLVSWEGILYDVGNDYLTIYQESRDRYIVSDYYSLKFIEFYDVQRRALCDQLLQNRGMEQTPAAIQPTMR